MRKLSCCVAVAGMWSLACPATVPDGDLLASLLCTLALLSLLHLKSFGRPVRGIHIHVRRSGRAS